MKTLTVKAPAKVNLSLRVIGKRSDGYHLLESLVVFAEYGDEIHVSECDELSLENIGEYGSQLTAQPIENNLVWKAAKALREYAAETCGARIILTKNLPLASGIGGGSADAAAALTGLRSLWNLPVTDRELAAIGQKLGSDIPVCLYGKPAIMRGSGEDITPFKLAEKPYILLVNPNIPLSTADVFRDFSGDFSPSMQDGEIIYDNDLESAAINRLPIIAEILISLSYTSGCYMVNMSGSGATCFGLYHDKESADNARVQLLREYPKSWCISSVIK